MAVVEGEEEQKKWHGNITVELPDCITGEQAWSIIGDFTAVNKWFTLVAATELITGDPMQPGCIRRNAGHPNKTQDPSNDPIFWAKEKLVAFNMEERSMTYEVIESNMGFNTFVSTIRVLQGGEMDQMVVDAGWSGPLRLIHWMVGLNQLFFLFSTLEYKICQRGFWRRAKFNLHLLNSVRCSFHAFFYICLVYIC